MATRAAAGAARSGRNAGPGNPPQGGRATARSGPQDRTRRRPSDLGPPRHQCRTDRVPTGAFQAITSTRGCPVDDWRWIPRSIGWARVWRPAQQRARRGQEGTPGRGTRLKAAAPRLGAGPKIGPDDALPILALPDTSVGLIVCPPAPSRLLLQPAVAR